MPIRQKVRPLLLLKKQFAHFQRVGPNTLALGNRLLSGQLGFRATSIGASVGSDDVTVNFTEDVVVTDPASGISITVNGQAATFTAVKGTRSMVYTLTSQNPLDYDDDVIWTYDSASAGLDPYTGADSGEVLSDSSFRRVLPPDTRPVPVVSSIDAVDQNTIVVTTSIAVTGTADLGVSWTGLTTPPTGVDP